MKLLSLSFVDIVSERTSCRSMQSLTQGMLLLVLWLFFEHVIISSHYDLTSDYFVFGRNEKPCGNNYIRTGALSQVILCYRFNKESDIRRTISKVVFTDEQRTLILVFTSYFIQVTNSLDCNFILEICASRILYKATFFPFWHHRKQIQMSLESSCKKMQQEDAHMSSFRLLLLVVT